MKKRLKKYNTGGTAYQPVGLPVDPAYIRDKKNLDNQSGFTKFMDTFGQVAMPIAASLIPGVGGAIAGGMGSMMQKKQLNTYENANGVSNSEYDTYARTGGTVPLNSSSFQVQGNPNVTDGNHIPALNAKLDHNEVVNTNPSGAFVYSTDLKDPVTGKPFSELAKKHNKAIGSAEKILAAKPYDEQAKSTITQSTKLLEGLAAQQEALATKMGHRNPDGSTKQPGQYQTGGNIIQLSKDTYFDQATNTYGRVVSQDDITKSKGYKLTSNGMAFIPYDGPELDYARKTYDPQGTGNPLLPKNVRTDMNKTPTRTIDMNARDPLLQTVGNDTTPGLSAFPDWYVAPGERDPFYPLAPDYWSNMAFGNGFNTPQPTVTNTTTPPATTNNKGTGKGTAKATTKTEPIPGRGPAATAEKRPTIWSPEYDAWQAKQDAANMPTLDQYNPNFAKPSGVNLSDTDRQKALIGTNVQPGPFEDGTYSRHYGPMQKVDRDADITNMTGLSENGITNYEVPGTGNYKTPFTIGDSLKFVELAGKFAGLQGGPEVQKARLDNTDVTKQYYDPRVAIAQSKSQFANYANTLSAPSLNLRRSMLGAAHAQTVGAQSNILSEYEKMNQGALANYQDRLANRNRFNAQMLSRNDDANAANRGAYDSATQNLFTSVGQFGEDLNRKRYGTDYVNMMATRYPDVFKDVIKTWMGNGN